MFWDMLVGRAAERSEIEGLLDTTRRGRGGALVLRGEAGVGKTALLEDAAQAGEDFRVVGALGVEFEAQLPFSALHELLRPLIGFLETLPKPQSNALKAALALEQIEGTDRFSVYAATLGLLASAAAEQPTLCVLDDAHWLDQSSAEALLFTARRIEHDPIAMLFAVRDPAPAAFAAEGVSELRIGGLTAEEARALVAENAPSLRPAAVDRVVETARGNPLALLEFSSSGAEHDEPAEPLPVGEAVERTFRERCSRLSSHAREAVLLAAVNDPAEPEALWRVFEHEKIGEDSLAEAERAGLLLQGRRLDFPHPLARSAIYHSAAPAERRAAHRALAASSASPERRAWHLAAAATRPDEEVAAALEVAAAEARARGGVSAEADALERAARLTPKTEARARRLFTAGLAAEAGGRLEHAEKLLAEAAALTANPELRADAVARRSYVLFDRGELGAALALASSEAEQSGPATAARLWISSGIVHVLLHILDLPTARATVERAAEVAGEHAADDLDLLHMLGWTRELSGNREGALALARENAGRIELGKVLAIDFANRLLFSEDYHAARKLFERIVAHAREGGELGNLAYALDAFSNLEARTGPLNIAYAASLESLQLTEPLGNDVALASSLARLALIESMLGRSGDALAHAHRSLEVAAERGDRWNEVRARAALGAAALAEGDIVAVAKWLEPAAEMLASGGFRHPNTFRIDADLVEARVRLGDLESAERHVSEVLEPAEQSGSSWAMVIGARCRAMLADDGHAPDAFDEALGFHEREPSPWERARTELAYGERLRRIRRRRDSRDHLHSALRTFDELGSRPWAERARTELRATGERVQTRGPTAQEQLTPQELQVSLAAVEGLTNKEIGARMFLSPKTVEFHLGRAYRKLGVHSRAELVKLFAERARSEQRLPA
jgi:DNA-binding CsgD family transcriptional regulator